MYITYISIIILHIVLQHHAGIIYGVFHAKHIYIYMKGVSMSTFGVHVYCLISFHLRGDGKLCSNSAVGFWSKWCPFDPSPQGVRIRIFGNLESSILRVSRMSYTNVEDVFFPSFAWMYLNLLYYCDL